jgi:hypothetical protein
LFGQTVPAEPSAQVSVHTVVLAWQAWMHDPVQVLLHDVLLSHEIDDPSPTLMAASPLLFTLTVHVPAQTP